MRSYKFVVIGKVQGVYYRVSVKNNALASNYKGYIKNLSNGDVETCVSCLESELSAFIDLLHKGSKSSKVVDIKQLECDEIFTKQFEIR